MGNCVSCNDQSSHEQSDYKFGDPDRRHSELQSSAGCGISSMRQSELYTNSSIPQGTCAPLTGGENSSNGSRTPGGSSVNRIISMDSSGGGSLSQKTEKKTFYSRIPPLGRSGSTDKKNSSLAQNSVAIKDNNNAYSESKIAALFDHYKDPQEECVLAEGIEKLCKDLEVKPEDFKMLVLAWKFQAEQMCRFSREEFFQGMKSLKTDTLQGVQARLPDIVTEVLSDLQSFKDLYRFSFKFGLDSDLGQRILPMDMAVSLWRVVFSQKEPEILDRWIEFLESNPAIRGIPRDTWNMFLNFVETVGSDLTSYDDTEAWPSLFDDFVEYENDKLNQNTISVGTFSSDKEQQFQFQIQQVIEIEGQNFPQSLRPISKGYLPQSGTSPTGNNTDNISPRFSNSSSPGSHNSHNGIK